MREDFCAFILTHGRPDRVYTYQELRRSGYTGKIFLVIDDEDKCAEEYRAAFPGEVLQFCKRDYAERFDEADNFNDRRSIFYARNACFDLAQQVGCRYFIELDDDYRSFFFRYDRARRYIPYRIKIGMDETLSAMVDFLNESGAATFCMSQGGDHLGGDHVGYSNEGKTPIRLVRKAMNTFVLDVERPLVFRGRLNEDVNTYTEGSRRGLLFLTAMQVQVTQGRTQSTPGGMTEMYLDGGTYLKSFYSVMFCPSAVKIGILRSSHPRIHHNINWHAVAPKILREGIRRPDAKASPQPRSAPRRPAHLVEGPRSLPSRPIAATRPRTPKEGPA